MDQSVIGAAMANHWERPRAKRQERREVNQDWQAGPKDRRLQEEL